MGLTLKISDMSNGVHNIKQKQPEAPTEYKIRPFLKAI